MAPGLPLSGPILDGPHEIRGARKKRVVLRQARLGMAVHRTANVLPKREAKVV
jgi:hypothetical protein